MVYRFIVAPERQVAGGGKLLTYPDDVIPRDRDDMVTWALGFPRFRCALLRLFGPPNVHRRDAVFEYAIDAIRDDEVWWLTAYEGPSGPSIGSVGPLHGTVSDLNVAALALLHLIAATPPADGAWTYEDDDYAMTVSYGCSDGRCWYQVVDNGEILTSYTD